MSDEKQSPCRVVGESHNTTAVLSFWSYLPKSLVFRLIPLWHDMHFNTICYSYKWPDNYRQCDSTLKSILWKNVIFSVSRGQHRMISRSPITCIKPTNQLRHASSTSSTEVQVIQLNLSVL
jgi:hypothetical protein